MRASDPRTRALRASIAPAAAGVLAFALCYALAIAFSRAGVFAYLDVLFDTDAAWFLQGFSEGRGTGTGWGARSLVHPNVANVINPPVRLIAMLCSTLGACAEPAATVRSGLALLVSPIAAAIETVFIFLTIRTIYRSETRAFLGALLNIALLPTLLFGAVPESFALTGCAFAALFYLASLTAAGRPAHIGWWVTVGVALSGMTVTNLWLFALVYAVVHARPYWLTMAASVGSVRVAVAALAGTAALALAVGFAYGSLSNYRTTLPQVADFRAPRQEVDERRWSDAVAEGFGLAATGTFQIFPKALGHTILPPPASIQSTTRGLQQTTNSDSDRPEPTLHANYRYTSADWGTFLALAVLAGAVIAAVKSREPQRLVYRAAIAVVLGNWVFHSMFGVEMFLYAKHWSVPVALLLTAWVEVRWPVAYAGAGAVVTLITLAAWREARVFADLFRAIAGT